MKLTLTEFRSAMAKRFLIIITPLALCIALALGCGQSESETASFQAAVQYAQTPTGAPASQAAATNAAAPTTSVVPSPLLVPTPTPPPPIGIMYPPYPLGIPALDENILNADVIAWVRPPVVTNKSSVIPSESGVAPTYRPFVEFEFEVVEYLKGSGGKTLTVESPRHHTYLTDKEALKASADVLTDRVAASNDLSPVFSAHADNREAVIFLRLHEESYWQEYYGDSSAASASRQVYYLEDSLLAYDPDDVDTSRKAWLPLVGEASGKSLAASDGSGDRALNFLNPEPIVTDGVAEPTELTLEYLRSRIDAVASMLKKGEGKKGYKECLAIVFAWERHLRVVEEVDGKPHAPDIIREGPFASGLPAGSEFRSSAVWGGTGYVREWYEGRDSSLFQSVIVADGVDIAPDYFQTRNDYTAYDISTRVTRPLPGGTYEVKLLGQSGEEIPCGSRMDPSHASTWIFTFESPDTAIHEAFFDPATIGSGGAVGADAANGVLKPTAFTFGGGSVSLDSIRWESQAAEMRLSPHTRLANHHADFIALDGSVALRLDFDDAAETGEGDSRALSWPVCAQPWQAGDLLMLRISESPSDLSGATRDGDCVSATAVPATPTVAPTPTPAPQVDTPTPTVAPDTPTPTPTPEMDTPTPAPDTPTPTVAPTPDTPAPAPTATPEMDTPTPAPTATAEADTPTPTVAPVPPAPTPEMDTPTTTPESDTPTPTPTPAA